jgi:intracellular septation protein
MRGTRIESGHDSRIQLQLIDAWTAVKPGHDAIEIRSASFLFVGSQMTSAVEKLARPKQNPWIKFLLEMGPLLLFFFANARPKLFEPLVRPLLPETILSDPKTAGLFTATVVLMVAVVTTLIICYLMTKRLPIMPLVTAILVMVFGALTLYLQDERFIKMKPTVLYLAFGLALFGGLLFGKPLLPIILDNAMKLTERGWRILTIRWASFFLVLAVLNEIIWRTQSTDVWVAFKFPGTMILIFLFTFSQVPLIMKNELKEEAAEKAPDHF